MRTRLRRLVSNAILTGLALLCVRSGAAAEALPQDSGLLNVRMFGARGDGVHDDTIALQTAIDAARVTTRFFWPTRIVYLPAGRYLVRNTLQRADASGRYQAQLALIGDGPEQTSIVLDDRCPGFTDASNPKAVLFTSSGLRSGSPTDGGKRYLEAGEGNDAYANFVEGMTIDVGADNPGAIAIDYLNNNFGAVRHVRLRAAATSGAIGLAMERRWPGPLLVSEVTIEGFNVGISIKHQEYGVTLEHVLLKGQKKVALTNSANMVAMRDVQIETAGTGIVNDDPLGLIVADLIRFLPIGGNASFARNVGYFTLRAVTRLSPRGSPSRFERGGAFFANSPIPGFAPDWHLAREPIDDTEAIPTQEWVSVAKFGASADGREDAAPAIQAALNSGARSIYFPTGTYRIDAPLTVPPSVQHIAGMFSVLRIGDHARFPRDRGMLQTLTAGKALTIERLVLDNIEQGSQAGIEHAGARGLVLRDFVSAGASIVRRATGGRLFMENALGTLSVSGPAFVTASQLNIEGRGVLIKNRGAPLSILGLKVEQNATVVENSSGGQTEILGALIYLVFPPDTPRPALMNFGAGRIFAAYVESAHRPAAIYSEHMTQVDDGQKRTVVAARDLPKRGMARVSPGRTLRGPSLP